METNSCLSTRRTRTKVTPKFNSSNCNMAFAKLQRTQSLARPTTHAAISTFSTSHNAISSPYSQPFQESCSTNTNYIFHAANKTYSYKHFDYRHLTSSSFLYYLTNLARKQLNVNTHTLHHLPRKQTTNNNNSSYTFFGVGLTPLQRCSRCILQQGGGG